MGALPARKTKKDLGCKAYIQSDLWPNPGDVR